MMLDRIVERVTGRTNNTEGKERLKMSICMLGARGVGKTSVITSLYYNQNEALSGTNLFITADTAGGTDAALTNKKEMLKAIFFGLHEEGSLMTEPGIAGDSAESIYSFTYGMSSEKINIDLEIRDYPGEYVKKEPEKVAKFIEEADAVLVAIDTPYLMEENGKYNEAKNSPSLISQFLINNLKDDNDKLVLLVPLKCEKYFRNDSIDSVTQKVEETYSELIAQLKSRRGSDPSQPDKKRPSICIAVTPIQTLGGVEFDSFEKNEDGEIKVITARDGSVIPEKVNYRYIATNAEYTPAYCEQPLYYLLGFVSKRYSLALKAQKSGGIRFFEKLKSMLRLVPRAEEFITEIDKLTYKRIEEGKGYKILGGRGRI